MSFFVIELSIQKSLDVVSGNLEAVFQAQNVGACGSPVERHVKSVFRALPLTGTHQPNSAVGDPGSA